MSSQPSQSTPPDEQSWDPRTFEWTEGRIRNLRLSLRDTQSAFASRLGVTRQAVHEWETGKAFPSPLNIAALDRLFALTQVADVGDSDPASPTRAGGLSEFELGVVIGSAQSVKRLLQIAMDEQHRVITQLEQLNDKTTGERLSTAVAALPDVQNGLSTELVRALLLSVAADPKQLSVYLAMAETAARVDARSNKADEPPELAGLAEREAAMDEADERQKKEETSQGQKVAG